MELVLRFIVGGVIVSIFAIVAECIQPKVFAGLFGAAPSVALAGILLTSAKEGSTVAAIEARYMVLGSIALLAYSLACARVVRLPKWPPWLGAGLMWIVWLSVACALWVIVRCV